MFALSALQQVANLIRHRARREKKHLVQSKFIFRNEGSCPRNVSEAVQRVQLHTVMVQDFSTSKHKCDEMLPGYDTVNKMLRSKYRVTLDVCFTLA